MQNETNSDEEKIASLMAENYRLKQLVKTLIKHMALAELELNDIELTKLRKRG